jgi:DNA ligase D-like protein (predicted 3'-phosphoesterase)
MAREDPLADYEERRDFRRTSEPRPRRRRSRSTDGDTRAAPRFVIHRHDASNLHYDLRIEVGDVLRSWAVPKGPSTDPRDRHLAVPTEDHPLDYEDFEGVIPEGEYGAGTVLVWDAGTYRNLGERDGEPVPVEDALADGHLAVWLDGEKLRGGWSLTRIRGGDDEAWLLVKMRDEGADARRKPVRTQPESVATGRTIEEVADEEAADEA